MNLHETTAYIDVITRVGYHCPTESNELCEEELLANVDDETNVTVVEQTDHGLVDANKSQSQYVSCLIAGNTVVVLIKQICGGVISGLRTTNFKLFQVIEDIEPYIS